MLNPNINLNHFLLRFFISLFYGAFFFFSGFFNDLIEKYYIFIGFLFALALFSSIIILPSFGFKKKRVCRSIFNHDYISNVIYDVGFVI